MTLEPHTSSPGSIRSHWVEHPVVQLIATPHRDLGWERAESL